VSESHKVWLFLWGKTLSCSCHGTYMRNMALKSATDGVLLADQDFEFCFV
jgi:hypothetical protein